MKQIITALCALLIWQNAFAIFDPGVTSKPISSSQMEVLDASGIYEGVNTAYLEKWSEAITKLFNNNNIDLSNKRHSFRLMIEDTTVQLAVKSVEREDCGSKVITLEEVVTTFPKIPSSASLVFQLTDHASRLCKDLKKHQWEMKVEFRDTFSPWTNGKLFLGGNPQAVYTILAQ